MAEITSKKRAKAFQKGFFGGKTAKEKEEEEEGLIERLKRLRDEAFAGTGTAKSFSKSLKKRRRK